MTENKEVGKVKFFDHKKGYGFVEVINPNSEYYGGSEIFVHFSQIKCDSQFKKLIPGEIISMNIGKKHDDDTKTVCLNVKGLYKAKLLIDNEKFMYKVRSKQSLNPDDMRAHGHDSRAQNQEITPEDQARDQTQEQDGQAQEQDGQEQEQAQDQEQDPEQ